MLPSNIPGHPAGKDKPASHVDKLGQNPGFVFRVRASRDRNLQALPTTLRKEKPCNIVLFVVEGIMTQERIRPSMSKCCDGAFYPVMHFLLVFLGEQGTTTWGAGEKKACFVRGWILFNWNVVVSFHIIACKCDQRDNGCDNDDNNQETCEIPEVLINDGDPTEKIAKQKDT